MLFIVLLSLVFAENIKCPVYMSGVEGETCGYCYNDVPNKEDTDCVKPQTIVENCILVSNSKEGICSLCENYYYLNETHECELGNNDHCYFYGTELYCNYCEKGYAVKELEDGKLTKCIESKGGCLKVDMNDEKKCIHCYGKIENGECKDNQPSIENCEVQESKQDYYGEMKITCLYCKDGYVCNNSSCTSCIEVKDKVDNCKSYYLSYNNNILCNECKDGYYAKIDKDSTISECIKNDIENCERQGNYFDGSDKYCDVCKNKYSKKDKDSSKCISTDIEKCLIVDENGKCKTCWSGYSLSTEGKCKKCEDENATKCSLDLKTSYACKDEINYAIKDGKCVQVNNLESRKKLSDLYENDNVSDVSDSSGFSIISTRVLLFLILILFF